jgi:hypothetical protein
MHKLSARPESSDHDIPSVDTSGLESSVQAACREIDRLRALNREMLKALVSICGSLESRLNARSKDVEGWDILNNARAAIRKARGAQ